MNGQQQKQPVERTAMDVFLEAISEQTQLINDSVRRLSAMHDRIYGPSPPTTKPMHEENIKLGNITLPNPDKDVSSYIIDRLDHEQRKLRDAAQSLSEQISVIEKYI